MQCLHVNIRQATFVVLSVIINNISTIQMADSKVGNNSESAEPLSTKNKQVDCLKQKCENLIPQCLKCDFNLACEYGKETKATCKVTCVNNSKPTETRQFICRYCYQTEPWEHNCDLKLNCNAVASPRVNYTTNCTVNHDILCLGNRTFNKNVICNWTGGYRWTTALLLSITLGGFGADRFYLGHWQEGIGKLFSFGGLGVWTIIDVILISLHYLGPADGSLYI